MAEIYRKVSVRIWADAKFRRLSAPQPNAQTLLIYLISHPAAIIPGFIPRGENALAEELGWPLKAFRKAYREAFEQRLVDANWVARFVWLKNAIKHNPPASPNVVKSWRIARIELPECQLYNTAIKELKAFLKGMGEGFSEALPKDFAYTEAEAEAEAEVQLPPFIPPLAGDDKKPKPKKSRKPKSQPTPEHIELIAQWKSHSLADTERAGQGYYAPSAAAQITTAIAEHGIEPIKSAIASYTARLKTKPDWRSYAVQFSTFFGPAKQIWRDHLPGDAPAPPQKNLTAGPTFKIPSQAIQPDDPANPKKYYSRILPQQPAQPKPKPEPTKD